MTSKTANSILTPKQTEEFHREGYLVLEGLFTDDDLRPVIDEVNEEVNQRASELVAKGELSSTYAEYGFERQLAMISAETDKVALSIWNGLLSGPAFFHLISHPKLLDIAELFCGEEVIASSVYRLRPKIPNYGYGMVPWHQDSGYFEPYCDTALVLTVWLPLVDAIPERGCMWVLPEAHRGAILRHAQDAAGRYLEIPNSIMPTAEAVCTPVRKGGVLLLSNLTPHASFENKSDIVRWSMDLRYQSAALPTNAQITRLPEESVQLMEPGTPVACYPPEADFLVRSRKRPNEVLTDPAAFHRLRREHVSQPITDRWSLR